MKFIKKNAICYIIDFLNLIPKRIQYFNLHMKRFSILKSQILCLNILHVYISLENKAKFLVNCKYNYN